MADSTLQTDSTFQTVRLAKGAHASPAQGACVIELASMLAGERFSDHPRCVCPVIAGFLRSYNDRLGPGELQRLYPLASLIVGSRSTWRVRRRRTRRLREWLSTTDPVCSAALGGRLQAPERIAVVAARAAAGLDPDLRDAAVSDLVHELVAVGHSAGRALEDRRPAQAMPSHPAPERGGDPALRHHDVTAL